MRVSRFVSLIIYEHYLYYLFVECCLALIKKNKNMKPSLRGTSASAMVFCRKTIVYTPIHNSFDIFILLIVQIINTLQQQCKVFRAE